MKKKLKSAKCTNDSTENWKEKRSWQKKEPMVSQEHEQTNEKKMYGLFVNLESFKCGGVQHVQTSRFQVFWSTDGNTLTNMTNSCVCMRSVCVLEEKVNKISQNRWNEEEKGQSQLMNESAWVEVKTGGKKREGVQTECDGKQVLQVRRGQIPEPTMLDKKNRVTHRWVDG